MTERRRFFPGVPAQQVPGRTVDLAMRLQRVPDAPAPVAASPGGGGDAVGPALLIEPWDYTATHDLLNRTYSDWRVVGADVEISPELAQPFRAVYVGGSAALEWDWTLDTSPMPGAEGVDWVWAGVTVTVQDGTALVTVGSGWTVGEDFGYALLTLTAFDGSTQLESVAMRLTLNLSNE